VFVKISVLWPLEWFRFSLELAHARPLITNHHLFSFSRPSLETVFVFKTTQLTNYATDVVL